MQFLLKEIIYGGHLLALGAGSVVFLSSFLLNAEISWHIILVSYLLFYPIYLYDRLTGLKKDYLTNKKRSKHIKKYENFIPSILIISIFLLFFLIAFFSNLKTLFLSFSLLVLGILYNVYFKQLTKKILFFKNFYVASFFSVMSFIPLFYYDFEFEIFLFPLVFLFVFVFLKSFFIQSFFDLKDVKIDQKSGLLTLPSVLGFKRTVYFLAFFSGIVNLTAVFLVFYKPFLLPVSFAAFILLIPFNFYCLKMALEKKYFAYILAGGEYLIWSFLVIFYKTLIFVF